MGRRILTLLAFLIFLLSIGIIAVVAYMYLTKDDDKKAEDTKQEEVVEVTPSNLFMIANCKFFEIDSQTGISTEINLTNNTEVECFEKKIFRNDYQIIMPSNADRIKDTIDPASLFLANFENNTIEEIEYDLDQAPIAVYSSENNKIYTYVDEEGIYEGTIADPLNKLIMARETHIVGRGGVYLDDYALRLSPNQSKLLFVDTISQSKTVTEPYKSIQVLDLEGNVEFSTSGTFAKWIDDSQIIYLDTSTSSPTFGKVVALDLSNQETTILPLVSNIYHIDVNTDLKSVSIGYFAQGDDFEADNLMINVYDAKNWMLRDQLAKNYAYSYILNNSSYVTKGVRDCEGELEAVFACPMDGDTGIYEMEVVLYNFTTSTENEILTFDDPEMPVWMD